MYCIDRKKQIIIIIIIIIIYYKYLSPQVCNMSSLVSSAVLTLTVGPVPEMISRLIRDQSSTPPDFRVLFVTKDTYKYIFHRFIFT
jgi:hypothetical protein